LKWFQFTSRKMSNKTAITTGGIAVANGGPGFTPAPHHVLTTVTASGNSNLSGSVLTTGINGSPFTFAKPSTNFKAGTITIKGEGSESAEFDASFINDLKLLLEVIQEVPDEHPLGDLKHDMRMRRAFKKLGG